MTIPILTNEVDEQLMRETLGRCYSQDPKGFRVSAEHYRYLAEQIVSLRIHIRRTGDTEVKHGDV